MQQLVNNIAHAPSSSSSSSSTQASNMPMLTPFPPTQQQQQQQQQHQQQQQQPSSSPESLAATAAEPATSNVSREISILQQLRQAQTHAAAPAPTVPVATGSSSGSDTMVSFPSSSLQV